MNNIEVAIYTDGACSGNPGNGGIGIVMEWVGKPYKKEFSEGFKLTTNNRMELLAVIFALERLKTTGLNIKIYSDSKYVVDSIEKKWVFAWEKKDFKGKKNVDLWIRLLKLYKLHNIKFIWIKGHNEHPQNEKCDKLAVKASQKKNLLEDVGYVKQKESLF